MQKQIVSRRVSFLRTLSPTSLVVEKMGEVDASVRTYAKDAYEKFYGSDERQSIQARLQNLTNNMEIKLVYINGEAGNGSYPVGWGVNMGDVVHWGTEYDSDEEENDDDAGEDDAAGVDIKDEISNSRSGSGSGSGSSSDDDSGDSCSSPPTNDSYDENDFFVPPPPYDVVRISYLLRQEHLVDKNLFSRVLVILTRDGKVVILEDSKNQHHNSMDNVDVGSGSGGGTHGRGGRKNLNAKQVKKIDLVTVNSVNFVPWLNSGGGGELQITTNDDQIEIFKICPGYCGDGDAPQVNNSYPKGGIVGGNSNTNANANANNPNNVGYGVNDSIVARTFLKSWEEAMNSAVSKAKEGEFMALASLIIRENERGIVNMLDSVLTNIWEISSAADKVEHNHTRTNSLWSGGKAAPSDLTR